MQNRIDLSADGRILKESTAQGNPVDRTITLQKGFTKYRAQRTPTRLLYFQQMPAALVNINKRRQTITGEQSTHTALSRANAPGYAEHERAHGCVARNSLSNISMSANNGAVTLSICPEKGWENRSVLAWSICRLG
jgi:hypothetical protein